MGMPIRVKLKDRIEALSDWPDKCWRWPGYRNRDGYGRTMTKEGKAISVHQWAYEMVVGAVPPGMELDHLCRNPSCFNPKHLEPVTHRENMLRSKAPMAAHAKQTHCKHGHEFTPENTRKRWRNGWRRECLKCERARIRKPRSSV